VHPLIQELKSALKTIPHPESGKPLVEHVFERDELYHGPQTDLAPDLTVVLTDWRYRTIGLHDFTTNRVISPAFGPTGDHRMDGILIAFGPAFRPAAKPRTATLMDIAPTALRLLGIPVPDDMDGQVLTELLEPDLSPTAAAPSLNSVFASPSGSLSVPVHSSYTADDDAAIQQRLSDLGYL
jgi:predicted AlkP superfamily phosphohydrolase/phosphomutase